ncbi:MAG: hypothetical protein JWO57_511, partial [Pseudonocardiales bacterium]|nr:hypothetical protein [Pseudonocardiales bacterium]
MTTLADHPTVNETLAALRRSHDRLVAALEGLTDTQVAGPSYDDDWSIGQVASHLGSGAEIFGLFLDAGLSETAAPGIEQIQPIWDRWNAKSPAEQARDAISADAAFLNRLDSLTADERRQWRLDMFGGEQTLASLLRMRLAEHALHTWDVLVVLDPAEAVAADAVELIIDTLPGLVGRAGKPTEVPFTVHVT